MEQIVSHFIEPMIDTAPYSILSVFWAFYVHYRYHRFNLTRIEISGGSG